MIRRPLLLRLALYFAIFGLVALAPVFLPACQQSPSAKVVEAKTLESLGQTAEAAVALSARLYVDGKLTLAQKRAVNDFFDRTWQPAFRIAVAAAQSNLRAVAPSDLLALAAQLETLVNRPQ